MGNMKKQKTSSDNYFKIEVNNTETILYPLYPVNIKNAIAYDKIISRDNFLASTKSVVINFSNITIYDSYLVIFIHYIQKLSAEKGFAFSITSMSDEMQSFYNLLSNQEEIEITDGNSGIRKYFTGVGNFALTFLSDLKGFIEFIGNIIIGILRLFIHPGLMRWKDFPFNFTRAGVNAVPIVMLIVFLIGAITGYQGALELHQFGADRFIADLIGISVVRELSPLMTSIIFAGRSGSAFAAEIGTMKVSEEIDALKTMGFDQFQFLVLPRVLSVMVAIPFVTMLANISGIIGGLLAALSCIDITTAGYINELQRAVKLSSLLTGLGKSVVFGFMISTVGCFRGLQVTGGAESVGKYTTAAVVSGILLIILSDAVFTVLFQVLGI